MSDVVLRVENLSKQYRLGLVGSGTLRDDVARWIAKARGKQDPTLKIGETNTLNTVEGEYVWALKDINFEVKRGEVLGIIGKNGAGKSTLLKILSKVTGPTTGSIKAKGRIASLLEVGTGMHPELTGRENIFLNGAILGMTKAEVRKKLDEIVDFAGIAKYVDTPIKRYSSGMSVRLGFAVAAFLEPEILIVDEVLAVGDAEFQKKAIGKMQDVSQGEGRTVLFVSHNMGSVKALCSRGLLLERGKIKLIDSDLNKLIDIYAKINYENKNLLNSLPKKNDRWGISIDSFEYKNDAENLNVSVHISSENSQKNLGIGCRILTLDSLIVASITPALTAVYFDLLGKNKAKNIQIIIPKLAHLLAGGQYIFEVWISKPKLEYIIEAFPLFKFNIPEKDIYNTGMLYSVKKHGLLEIKGIIDF